MITYCHNDPNYINLYYIVIGQLLIYFHKNLKFFDFT
jgi:hypothetical protein